MSAVDCDVKGYRTVYLVLIKTLEDKYIKWSWNKYKL